MLQKLFQGNKPMKKIIYSEGNWFAVPLRSDGFAMGLVARGGFKTKCSLGYFFGPKSMYLPEATQVEAIKAEEAILIAWFGDLGIIQGKWSIIKTSRRFVKQDWPVPLFRRIDSVTPTIGRLIEYDQDNPKYGRPIHEIIKDASSIFNYPEDSLFGSGAIEIKLTKLLEK